MITRSLSTNSTASQVRGIMVCYLIRRSWIRPICRSTERQLPVFDPSRSFISHPHEWSELHTGETTCPALRYDDVFRWMKTEEKERRFWEERTGSAEREREIFFQECDTALRTSYRSHRLHFWWYSFTTCWPWFRYNALKSLGRQYVWSLTFSVLITLWSVGILSFCSRLRRLILKCERARCRNTRNSLGK